MDSSNGRNGSGDEENYNSREGKKQYHRHTTEQIQQLEAFYSECPHPDKNQRQQLSRELGLDQKQIKFWFQNKRTQIKALNERADNNSLRSENERIHFENLSMHEVLKNAFCPSCNSSGVCEEEKRQNLQRLRIENARLKEEYERAVNFFTNYTGNPALPFAGTEPSTSAPGQQYLSQHWSTSVTHVDKSVVIETAVAALNEFMELLRVNEPLWFEAPSDHGRYTLRRDSYDMIFPKSNQVNTSSARFESSKDSGEVAMSATHLIEMLVDVNKWKEIFPTIVTKATTLEVIDTGIFGGLLHLMYQKMHILSPLVAPREFFFIRYSRQIHSSTWVLVDVSYDFITQLQDSVPTRSWRFPSGCIIQDISNGKSTVTWIEHVQVNDKLSTHRLYRDFVCGSQAYGAKRWISTLQRMCERFAFSNGLIATPTNELEGVIESLEGKRNVMNLSQRMVTSFFEVLCMSDKLDFPNPSEYQNSGVCVALRKSDGPHQPDGFIVGAATSLWLPFSKEHLFNFFQDEKRRAQWDVLSNGNPVIPVAHISTGTHPGNRISVIQPFVPKENKMLVLQESSIDSLGAAIIYAPMDLKALLSAVKGDDATKIPILPSGFVISTDGRASRGSNGASTSSNTGSGGSLLTVAFQIFICRSQLTTQLNMESVATVHTLISSTVKKIKAALDYHD
ncbi:hypothetical protein ACP275_11G093800 [Erythranthe tilingii]